VKAAPVSDISFSRPKRTRLVEKAGASTRQTLANFYVQEVSSVDDATSLFAAIVDAGLRPVVLTTVQPQPHDHVCSQATTKGFISVSSTENDGLCE
jgi:hypothetical protein